MRFITGRTTRALRLAALVVGVLLVNSGVTAEPQAITVASTTSTENSGLFAYLLPRFTAESGIAVQVVAVGTGQAIRIATNGDADVLLVHHEASERKYVADGFGLDYANTVYTEGRAFSSKPSGHDGSQPGPTPMDEFRRVLSDTKDEQQAIAAFRAAGGLQ